MGIEDEEDCGADALSGRDVLPAAIDSTYNFFISKKMIFQIAAVNQNASTFLCRSDFWFGVQSTIIFFFKDEIIIHEGKKFNHECRSDFYIKVNFQNKKDRR